MRVGSCSWKYPEWKDLVYPEGTTNLLEAYSRQFSTVEIDQWFWSLFDGGVKLPDPATVASYASSVEKDFRFTIKLPDSLSLTHFRKPKSQASSGQEEQSGSGKPGLRINPHFLSTELLGSTLANLSPLLGQTDVLILQFEYLNRQKMPGWAGFEAVLEDFFGQLPADVSGASAPFLGIELRNDRYITSAYAALLSRYQISPVFIHGYYLPPVYETIPKLIDHLGTQAPVVIRLHGPDRQDMDRLSGKTWNRIVREMDEDLTQVAATIRLLENRGIETIINVNNHYEGSAPLSIKKLLELL